MPYLYKQIDGWFDEAFAKVYDKIVHDADFGDDIVEIGCWKGCSSIYLLEKIKEEKKFLGCHFYDTWTGNEYGNGNTIGVMLPEFLTNLKNAGFEYDFEAVAIDSIEASKRFKNESIFAVMLDGKHCVKYVSDEIDAWLPKIKKNGILAFHDYLDCNLRNLFNQKLKNIQDMHSCGVYIKQ